MLCVIANIPIAQIHTLGKKCEEQNKAGITSLFAKKYLDALDRFSEMEKFSTTSQEKEATAIGKAEAYNGMGQYEEAILASDLALKISGNKSLAGHFQKGYAQLKLKLYALANASFSYVWTLTGKNKNKQSRAADYALLSALQFRQMENTDSAFQLLNMAIALDSTNPRFVLQKGELFAYEKRYDAAFVQYDKAVAMGKSDIDMYTARSYARLQMLQDKYATTDLYQLKVKMTDKEQKMLCGELSKTIRLGAKDIKIKSLASEICK